MVVMNSVAQQLGRDRSSRAHARRLRPLLLASVASTAIFVAAQAALAADGDPITQTDDMWDTLTGVGTYIQTDGTMWGEVDADTYILSGGVVDWIVNATEFDQSGGEIDPSASVTTSIYRFTGDGVSGKPDDGNTAVAGNIDASDLYDFNPTADVTFDGHLIGSGKLVKSGSSTLTLTDNINRFTGDIEIDGGILDLAGDPTSFSGKLTGTGTLQHSNGGTFGVAGNGIDLAALNLTINTFRIGTAYLAVPADDDQVIYGSSSSAKFGTITMSSVAQDDEGNGITATLEVEHGSTLTVGQFDLIDGSLTEAPFQDDDTRDGIRDLPTAVVNATTFTQSGGVVSSVILNVGTYNYSGGSFNDAELHATTFNQTGGGFGEALSVANFAMSGSANLGSSAVVGFSNSFTLGDTAKVESGAQLNGGTGSVVTQTGGTMKGTVTGVATYSQSGGTMASTLTGLDRYTQSGGSITGHVTTDIYELAGGTAADLARITVGNQIVQSGGTMGATTSVKTYTQTGGAMTGSVTASKYQFSGGTLGSGTISVSSFSNPVAPSIAR